MKLIYFIACSEHRVELEKRNTRNLEDSHKKEFVKWFAARVSIDFSEIIHY